MHSVSTAWAPPRSSPRSSARTKAENEGFNPEVDGCETFVLRDGSTCEWVFGTFTYVARAAR